MSSRVVALIDMDCFYVQVEERLNPDLKGKPAAVVQYNTWKGGGIIAVNYEARDKGVTRFMRGDEAKEKCPEIILIKVNEVRGKADLTKYRDAGNEVLEVMCKFCKCVQRASVDEAYLDLTEEVDRRIAAEENPGDLLTSLALPNTYVVGYTEDGINNEDARSKGLSEWLQTLYDEETDPQNMRLAMGAAIVEEMRAAILKTTTFKCSAGISTNKVLSKLSCGLHKPNRQTLLPHSSVEELFSRLPIRKVRSLGGKFGLSLVEELGCNVMGDILRFSESDLQKRFDEKTGSWLFNLARGFDNDPVVPRLISKSIGCCKKFPGRNSLCKRADVAYWMLELASEMGDRLSKDMAENKRRARLLTVHIQHDAPNGSSLTSSSRSGTLTSYEPAKISADAIRLIAKNNSAPANSDAWVPALKFVGLSAGKFVDEDLGQMCSIQRFFVDSKVNDEGHSTLEKTGRNSSTRRFFGDSKVNDERQSTSKETGQNSSIQRFFRDSKVNGEQTSISEESPCRQKNDFEDGKVKCLPSTSDAKEIDEGTSRCETNEETCDGNQSSCEEDDKFLLGSPQQCSRCSAQIPVALLPEHLDHHVAMDLHVELNSNGNEVENISREANNQLSSESHPKPATSKVAKEKKKRTRIPGTSRNIDKVTKVRKIVDFFIPK